MKTINPHHAARRHRASVESFVKSGQVDDAAREAEPRTPVEEVEMFDAERIGEARSKGEDPAADCSRPSGGTRFACVRRSRVPLLA